MFAAIFPPFILVDVYLSLAGGALLSWLVARALGVPVSELGLGVGPVLREWVTRSGLRIKLAPVPGGFLRVPGWKRAAGDEATYTATHGRRDLGKRLVMVIVAPLVPILASFVPFALYMRLVPADELALPLEIAKVDPGGEAERAGLRTGDQVLEIATIAIASKWDYFEAKQLCARIDCHFRVRRGADVLTIEVKPETSGGRKPMARFDFELARRDRERGWEEALRTGIAQTWVITLSEARTPITRVLGRGPDMVVTEFNHEAMHGHEQWEILRSCGTLLIALGLLQLLPVRGLAGASLVLLGVEGVRGRQPAARSEARILDWVTGALAIGLLLTAAFSDPWDVWWHNVEPPTWPGQVD